MCCPGSRTSEAKTQGFLLNTRALFSDFSDPVQVVNSVEKEKSKHVDEIISTFTTISLYRRFTKPKVDLRKQSESANI